MSNASKCLLLLNVILVTLVCAFAASSQIGDMNDVSILILDALQNRSHYLLVLGISGGVILFDLTLAAIGLTRSVKETHIRFENEDGELSIALTALEEVLGKIIRSMDGIHDVKVMIVENAKAKKTRRVKATIAIAQTDTRNMLTLEKKVQENLKTRFSEMITDDREVRYDVSVRKMKIDKQQILSAPSKDEEQSFGFSRPEYPVNKADG